MSWIKNVWNRMFTDTDEVEEIDEEIIYEEAPTEKKEKAPFRFPLIPDEEKDDFSHDIKRPEPSTKMPIFDEQERTVYRKEVEKPLMGPKEAPVRSVSKPKRKAPELPIQNARRFEPSRSVSPVHGYNVSRPEPIQKKVEEQRESKLDREMYDEAIQEKARAGFHKPRTQVEPEIRSSYEKESVQQPKTEVKRESRATSVVSNTVSFVLEAREREEKALLLKEAALEEATELHETSLEIELVSKDEEVEAVAELEFEVQLETEIELVTVDEEADTVVELKSAEQPETEIEVGVTEQQSELYNKLDVKVQAESEVLSEPTTEEIEEPQASEVQVDTKPEGVQKREKTVPFNVLMLKSDKESLKNKAKSLSVTTPYNENPVAQVPEAEKKR